VAKGAHGIANGISTIYKLNNGKLGAMQINAALKELGTGQAQFATAAKQITAVGRKKS
jgi:hypothetical protein